MNEKIMVVFIGDENKSPFKQGEVFEVHHYFTDVTENDFVTILKDGIKLGSYYSKDFKPYEKDDQNEHVDLVEQPATGAAV